MIRVLDARRTLLIRQRVYPFLLDRPRWVGSGLLLLLTAAVLLSQAVQARIPFGTAGEPGDLFVIALHVLLAAYLPAAYLAVLTGARRRLELLDPLFTVRAGYGVGLPPLTGLSRAWVVAGLLGVALGMAGPYLTEPHRSGLLGFWDHGGWSPETVWHRVLGLVVGVWAGWFFFAVLRTSRDFSRAAREIRGLDPFQLRALRPFAQQGLTNGLLVAGFVSLGGLFVFDQGITPLLALLVSASVALIGVALALPLAGVRRRIRTAKQAELLWCDSALERERQSVREGPSSTSDGRLADLLAYRTLVEQVHEWPIDAPVLRRMVLYLLIPLASWVASAVVQHGVERVVSGP